MESLDEDDLTIIQSWLDGWSIGEQENRGEPGRMCLPGRISHNRVRETIKKLGLSDIWYEKKIDEFKKLCDSFGPLPNDV